KLYHAKSRFGEVIVRTCKRAYCVAFSGPMHSEVTFLAALVAGLVSFLSPCVLPLVPPYLVFLAGTSLERFAEKEAEPRVRRETVIAAGPGCLGVRAA